MVGSYPLSRAVFGVQLAIIREFRSESIAPIGEIRQFLVFQAIFCGFLDGMRYILR